MIKADVQFCNFLSRSTDSYFILDAAYSNSGASVVYYSETAYILQKNRVRWHDDSDHCPTWTYACRCDVEEGS